MSKSKFLKLKKVSKCLVIITKRITFAAENKQNVSKS